MTRRTPCSVAVGLCVVGSFLVAAPRAAVPEARQDQTQHHDVQALRRAAVQGDAEAARHLTRKYLDGDGVPQDDVEAWRWVSLAAEQGDADAQVVLGHMYRNGLGVTQDDVKALLWYRLAALQVHAAAHTVLGYLYAEGLLVPQDDAAAFRFFRIAESIARVERIKREWKRRGQP